MSREMEALDRGVVAVAVAVDGGVYVRWRLFGTDPEGVAFNLYRDGERANDDPIEGSTDFTDPAGAAESAYAVAPVVDGEEGERSALADVWNEPYLDVPLNKPAATEDPEGNHVTYSANDASVGDLTGDGTYDVVLKWDPSNSKDNAHDGYTSPVVVDAYTLDGDHLWRLDLGVNVRAGAHYTQFLVYDFDGDGSAEVAMRTADGATDGQGDVVGDPDADYRNDVGRVLEGPEYLSVFDGETGAEVARRDFEPARDHVTDWGDSNGNRADRFLACVAYLDGEHPSIVMTRGYYERTALAAYDFRGGDLSLRWLFDTDDGHEAYEGQGNHQVSVADVDGDGKDEIVFGACVIDQDGTGLYSTEWGHGDALHVGDFHPGRDGLEVYQVHERHDAPHGASFRDAGTGELLWGEYTGADTGRGMIADVNPEHEGAEFWAPAGVGRWSADGEKLGEVIRSYNFGVWWTGDLLRELLDHDFSREEGRGIPEIVRWDWEDEALETLERFEDLRSNNWTKGNPCLSGDLLGDWREEVLLRHADSEALRLCVTTHETEHRIPTLMHDPQYRLAIAWQNVAYNQPPHPSFFLGEGMDDPTRADIEVVGRD